MLQQFTLLSILLLTLSTLTLAGFSCDANYFLKSANTDRYYTVSEDGGWLSATGTHRGWYQQFTVCRDPSWAPQFFVLKSEAISSKNGQDSYVTKTSADYFLATTGQLTGNHLFEWGRTAPYWALVHAETGGYLTANAGYVTLGPRNLGWNEALWRED